MSSQYIPPIDNRATQHERTDHLAIRNTLFRRFLTLLALKTTARFYAYDGPCVPVSKHVMVKSGDFVHLTEAATMEFIAAKTSIPVPRVHSSFVHGNRAYIVMERIQGESLAKAWRTLSESDLESIFLQLRRMFRELRALPPSPGTGIESCVGGSLRDPRNPRSRPRFGPFRTAQDFHLWLREGLRPEEPPNRKVDQDWEDIKEMVARQDGPWPPCVFTHGDLNPFNILVRGDQVVAITDWESAGWYPHYWEYTSAWCGSLIRQSWQDTIAKSLEPYPEELRMEMIRQRWWGEF